MKPRWPHWPHKHIPGRIIRWAGSIILILIIVIGAYGYHMFIEPVDLGSKTVTIIVKQGDTFGKIADKLTLENVVRSRATLWYAALWSGVDRRLLPGRYDFTGNVSVGSIIKKFLDADIVMVRVTVPEGQTLWETISILSRKLALDSTEMMKMNEDAQFLAKLDVPYLEGYLFPETYDFPWGTDAHTAITRLVHQFKAATDSLWPSLIVDGLSREEVITLASIVEAETRLDNERPIVASVYLNRIRIGMKLDADPTVAYGLGRLNRMLTRRDLKFNTPYNTYLHSGLPPTPINSPGLAAIKAVLRPASTPYLFFVANNTGGHQFSRTNDEHNIAKLKIRFERDQASLRDTSESSAE